VRILIVEDDVRIASVVRRALAEAGYVAHAFHTVPDGLAAFESTSYDLVVLDVMIGDRPSGGFELCSEIRRLDPEVPVLLLTALNKVRHKVEGLDVGADDYIVKPVHVLELLARVRALLRRSPGARRPVLTAGDLTLETATRTASRAGRSIVLTAKEFALLEYLMSNPGTVVSESELVDRVWDGDGDRSNLVASYIRYLRRKINGPGERDLIETRRGLGYVVSADSLP